MLQLETPEEPAHIKKQIKEIREMLAREASIDRLSQDTLSVWIFNLLPKYLWDHWGPTLRKNGITWQKFLRLLKYDTKYIRLWAFDKISWEDLIKEVKNTINTEIKYRIL